MRFGLKTNKNEAGERNTELLDTPIKKMPIIDCL